MEKPTPAGKDPVLTMLTIAAGFFVIYYFTKAETALVVSLVIGLTGLTSTYLTHIVHVLWWKLTAVLSLVIPKVVLTVIYFFVLVPVSFLARLFGRSDILRLKNNSASLYQDRNTTFGRSSFEKPW